MMNQKRKVVFIIILIVFLLVIFMGLNKSKLKIENADIETSNANFALQINNPSTECQDLKVLIIETNPILTSIKNEELYPNNNGSPKWSELFEFDPAISVSEQVEDFEDTSHGYIDINIVEWNYLNEFPTYTKPVVMDDETILTEEITYGNGKKGYRMKENTYLNYAYDDKNDTYSWWKLYENGIFGGNTGIDNSQYSFDYQYIIEKYDLINRKNNNEFDQVWLVGMDPMFTFETMMVGKTPFWVNGTPYVAECNNFIIGGASMSRRDAQLHAFGHGIEGIMNAAFNKGYTIKQDLTGKSTYKYYISSYNSYKKDTVNISSVDSYNELNWWEKFLLNDYTNAGQYSSVGNVHFTFNGIKDYDYTNTNNTYTNWREWLNYPNIKGNFTLDDCNAWLNNEINQVINSNYWYECNDPDRLYMRFWLYLMPHISGYTEDGYLNNWWKYIYSLDFVDSITKNDSTSKQLTVGDKVSANYTLNYASERKETLLEIYEGNNIQIGNKKVLNFINGKLYAVGEGSSTVKINYDGKNTTYNVNVKSDSQVNVTGIELNKTNIILNVGENETLVATVTPNNVTNKNVTWSSNNPSVATVNTEGKVTAVKKGRATITAKTVDGNKTATCNIIVNNNLEVEFLNYLTEKSLSNEEIIYLRNIKAGTSLTELKSQITTNGKIKLYDINNNIITNQTTNISTGMKLSINKDSENVEFILVVMGDITGDGKSDTKDLLKLARLIAKIEKNISEPYYIAANIYKDTEKAVNSADLLKLARILLKLDKFDI